MHYTGAQFFSAKCLISKWTSPLSFSNDLGVMHPWSSVGLSHELSKPEAWYRALDFIGVILPVLRPILDWIENLPTHPAFLQGHLSPAWKYLFVPIGPHMNGLPTVQVFLRWFIPEYEGKTVFRSFWHFPLHYLNHIGTKEDMPIKSFGYSSSKGMPLRSLTKLYGVCRLLHQNFLMPPNWRLFGTEKNPIIFCERGTPWWLAESNIHKVDAFVINLVSLFYHPLQLKS